MWAPERPGMASFTWGKQRIGSAGELAPETEWEGAMRGCYGSLVLKFTPWSLLQTSTLSPAPNVQRTQSHLTEASSESSALIVVDGLPRCP